ncbi:MAG: hypothetical protein ACJ76U_08745 [Gaiellaceae bacterium]
MAKADSQPGWVEFALAEYNAHRTANNLLFTAGQQTLAFGATAVGVTITAGVAFWDQRLPSTLIFLAVLPLLSTAIVVQWVGQALHLSRIGFYLERLEDTLRSVHSDTPRGILVWERWLHSMQSTKRPDYRAYASAAVLVFSLLTLGSILLGSYRAWHGHKVVVVIVAILETVALAALAALLASQAMRSAERVRHQALTWDAGEDTRSRG